MRDRPLTINKQFRTAYLTSPVRNFSVLIDYCDEIKFLSKQETVEQLSEVITDNLKDYDPEYDVIIPAGRSLAIFIAGICVRNLHPDKPFWMGIYMSKDMEGSRYEWLRVK